MSLASRLKNRIHLIRERAADRRLGIEATEYHPPHYPGLPEYRGYGPTAYCDWRIIERYIEARPDTAFVDYGSGLGRSTILAALLPFARSIGVEFDADLVRRANADLARLRCKTACPVEYVCCDASTFDVPNDAGVFYFCNPFTGSILDGVLLNIRKSLDCFPRRAQLVCNLPERSGFEDQIRTVDWLVESRSLAVLRRAS